MPDSGIQDTDNASSSTSLNFSFIGFWRRLAAQVIDGVIFMPLNYLLVYIFWKNLFLATTTLLFIMAIYYVSFLSSAWQATIGKRLMNIYVITKNGGKPSLIRAISRFIMFMAPGLPAFIPSLYITYLSPEELAKKVNAMHFEYIHQLVFSFYSVIAVMLLGVAVLLLIWYVPIFFTKEKKTVHDMVCGTRVVKGRVTSLPKE